MAEAKVGNVRTGADASGAAATPSEVIINEAAKRAAADVTEITDAKGRHLKIKKLKSIDRMRLFKICGKDSGNDRYVGMAALAYAVMAIDGEDEPAINTARELEALIGRLDDEGVEAVGRAYVLAGWAEDTDGVLSEEDVNHVKN